MKKILTIAAVASLAMVSCKKDYTCECTVKDSSGTIPTTTTSATAKMKKADAETWCENNKSTVGTISTSCELK